MLISKEYRKEVFVGFILFVIPFLPYVHLFFLESPIDGFFKHFEFVNFFGGIDGYIYSVLSWLSPLFIFIILFSEVKSHLKPFFLFIFFLISCKLFLTAFPFFNLFEGDYKQIISTIFFVLFLLLFLAMARKFRTFKELKISALMLEDWWFIAMSVSIPFFYHIWIFYPDGVSEIKFGFITIQSWGFGDAGIALNVLTKKICFLLPCIFFFFILKKWWKYALLSSIILHLYQIFAIMDYTKSVMDEDEIFEALPVLLFIALMLIFLSKSASYQFKFKLMYRDFMSKMEEMLGEKHAYKDQYLEEKREGLKKLRQREEKIDIAELLRLKSELEQELNART